MATKPEKQSSSIKRGSIDFDLALPDSSIPDKDIAEIDAVLAKFAADLPGLDFDFVELDELLGLGDPPAVPHGSHDPESRKNAHTRDMGYSGDGTAKSKQVCGAKSRNGTPCQAPGNGKGGRCKLHGGKSSGPKTQEGKARSLAALRRNRPSRKRKHGVRSSVFDNDRLT